MGPHSFSFCTKFHELGHLDAWNPGLSRTGAWDLPGFRSWLSLQWLEAELHMASLGYPVQLLHAYCIRLHGCPQPEASLGEPGFWGMWNAGR